MMQPLQLFRKHVAATTNQARFSVRFIAPPPARSGRGENCRPILRHAVSKLAANLAIFRALVRLGGVDNDALRQMCRLSRRVITELSDQKPTREWCDKLERKFLRLARTPAGDPDHGTG